MKRTGTKRNPDDRMLGTGYTVFRDFLGLQEAILGLVHESPHTVRELQRKISRSGARKRIPEYSRFMLLDAIDDLMKLGMLDADEDITWRDACITSV